MPFKKDEILSDIVNRIGMKLNVTTEGNFSAFRIGKDENRSAIKVVFKTNDTKLAIMKSKERFELNSKKLGYTQDKKIYINHDLTKTNLELYMAAKNFKKENNFRYLWISNGSIFLRRDENSATLLIDDKEKLEN